MVDVLDSIALRPPEEQATTINELAAKNVHRLEPIVKLFANMTGNSVFRLDSEDRERLARVALVTLVYDEMGYWQWNEFRRMGVASLCHLCDRLAIEFADVILMHQHIHELSEWAQNIEVSSGAAAISSDTQLESAQEQRFIKS